MSMPISCNRKRKDLEEEEEDVEPDFERQSGTKGVRRWANLRESTQEAQFHPLPQDLNLQMLANLGYNVTNNQQPDIKKTFNMGTNHSPSSSASDLCPSTPTDIAGSAESYFTKGIKESNSCPSYPTFNIYPEYAYPRPPGLLGMQMTQTKSSQSFASSSDAMDIDGEEAEGPVHGPQCKSIPQLLCRGGGATKELWARCNDCGTMSQVDTPPLAESLSFSP